MEFKPKTQEQIMAQVEHFADKGVKEFSSEQKLLLKYSKELSTVTDLDNLPENLPEELKKLIEDNRSKYIEVLRSSKKEDIEFRKQNIELYNSKFKPVIDSLKEKISNSHNSKELPEYLGSGSNGSAYMIEVNGKKYAAKFSKSLIQANFETKPLLQARGVENVAQLVSYSFADGVVIMELLHGTDVTNFTPENAPEYSEENITKLIETVIELDKKGIVIDPKPSNFMYDEEHGFSVLDFHIKNPKSDHTLADSIMDLRLALSFRKWPYIEYNTPEYKKQSVEKNKIYLPIMIKFIGILKNKFPEILENYKKRDAEIQANPHVSRSPVINRKYMETENPEIKQYLEKLEEMGF